MIRPWSPDPSRCSIYSLIVYLNDEHSEPHSFVGGETNFVEDDGDHVTKKDRKILCSVKPKQGSALIFKHEVCIIWLSTTFCFFFLTLEIFFLHFVGFTWSERSAIWYKIYSSNWNCIWTVYTKFYFFFFLQRNQLFRATSAIDAYLYRRPSSINSIQEKYFKNFPSWEEREHDEEKKYESYEMFSNALLMQRNSSNNRLFLLYSFIWNLIS